MRGGARDAGGRQLHGDPRPRAGVPRPDARAHAPARDPADGVGAERASAGVRRVDRGAARRVDGDQRVRSRDHHPGRGRARVDLRRSRDARARHADPDRPGRRASCARRCPRRRAISSVSRASGSRPCCARCSAATATSPAATELGRAGARSSRARGHGDRRDPHAAALRHAGAAACRGARCRCRTAPTFRAIVYDNSIDQQQHMALVLGDAARRRRGPRAPALGVPHRRRLRLAALRLRRAARAGACS